MVRREKVPELVLRREDATGKQPSQKDLSNDARLYMANRKREDRPFFRKTDQGADKWQDSEEKRTESESRERIEKLSHNVWLAHEIFIQAWIECMDEIVMIHNIPLKEAFKPSRFKLTKPIHPSEGPNRVAFVEAQRAIEMLLPDHKSDTYEKQLGELMKEVEYRWRKEHSDLKDDIEFQAANDRT